MNIIAGTARGRKLVTLPGEATRPTQAKVRGALFSILNAWTADAAWLDLYAGTGAIGLEAASRGARRAILVENAPAAIAVIRQNLATTKLAAELIATGVDGALRQLTATGAKFDVIFMDPPYAQDPQAALDAAAALLLPMGRLVLEHKRSRKPPEAAGGLVLHETRAYADTALTFYTETPRSE
jgi:16S rRNA (guanine966-N2)-methyltransferase